MQCFGIGGAYEESLDSLSKSGNGAMLGMGRDRVGNREPIHERLIEEKDDKSGKIKDQTLRKRKQLEREALPIAIGREPHLLISLSIRVREKIAPSHLSPAPHPPSSTSAYRPSTLRMRTALIHPLPYSPLPLHTNMRKQHRHRRHNLHLQQPSHSQQHLYLRWASLPCRPTRLGGLRHRILPLATTTQIQLCRDVTMMTRPPRLDTAHQGSCPGFGSFPATLTPPPSLPPSPWVGNHPRSFL